MGRAFVSPRPICAGLGQNAILARLLSDAVEALDCDTDRARATLSRAVALIGESLASAPNNNRGGLAAWQAQKAIALIDERLERGARVTELAADVRLSQSHFSRAFKQSFKCCPQEFILRRRVERAQQLMLKTDKQLSDIALACGFSDQAHFSRMFRKCVGLSPKVWRRAPLSV
jgi:AraC family transcriptional regulator